MKFFCFYSMSGLSSSEESMLMSNGFSVNDMQDIGGSGAFEGKSKISDVIFIVKEFSNCIA